MEKELRKAFEEVTKANVQSILHHSNETRKLLREMEASFNALDGLVRQQQQEIGFLKQQLVNVQAIVFRGGTDGNNG